MYEESGTRFILILLNFSNGPWMDLILEDFERVVRLPQDLSPGTLLCVSIKPLVGDNPFGQICF